MTSCSMFAPARPPSARQEKPEEVTVSRQSWCCNNSLTLGAKEIEAIAQDLKPPALGKRACPESARLMAYIAKGGNPLKMRKALQCEKEVTNELAQHVVFEFVFHRQVHGCDITTNCCPVTSLTAHSLTTVWCFTISLVLTGLDVAQPHR